MSGQVTVRNIYDIMRNKFRTSGLPTPDLDARCLVANLLGCESHEVLLSEKEKLGAEREAHAIRLMDRRLKREPIAYITGDKEFWGFSVAVTPDVLIPRPDSECLIETIIAEHHLSTSAEIDGELRILDIGTGSGCLLFALIGELTQSQGVGLDIKEAALRQASRNADRLGFGDRCAFVCGNETHALGGEFDLIISNPPYIPTSEISRLDPDIRCYEPVVALDGGADGLAFYPRIAMAAARLLAPGGRLVVEHGSGQQEEVINILSNILDDSRIDGFLDLAGRPRGVIARREKK